MALSKEEKVHGIIHTASAAAAGVGAGLAQIPASDALVIMPIQGGMISAIALVHNRKLTEGSATAILGTFTAAMFGRAATQVLVGWIPGAGNTINAATAAALTETIGWSAHKFFEQLGEENLTDEQVVARARADISMSAQDRDKQAGFLRKKNLLNGSERLLAFYNNALMSPIFDDDHTNTCMFITEKRVVQVKDSRTDISVHVADAVDVHVEHNFSFINDDYVIVVDRHGIAHRFVVIRNVIGQAMKALIKALIEQGKTVQ